VDDPATAPSLGATPRALDPVAPVEPVHWGARLVRAPGVVYTEVADTPVLIRVDDAEMQPLPPAWAAVWAELDGRSVAEALDVDPARVDPITSRNLFEVLRRLKAKRLVADVDSLSPADRATATTPFPDDQPVAGPTDIVLRGHLVHSPDAAVLTLPTHPALRPSAHRSGDASPDPATSPKPDPSPPSSTDDSTSPSGPLDGDLTDPVTVHLVEADGIVLATVDREPVAIVTASPVAVAPDDPDGDALRCISTLADLLAALADPACLAEPGVVDLLASLADQARERP
jgi:hypothetical protein